MRIFFNDTELELPVNDNSYRYRAIKGEHSLTLYYSLPQHIEIPIGAYCIFEGEEYTLEKPENFKMYNTRNFEYTLIMDSVQEKLSKYKFKDITSRRLKFPLTAQPKEHLKMLVDNLNLRESDWTVGECITAAEKVISYNHAYCNAALSQMADEFETEWEIVGKKISLRKVEYNKDNPLPLSYGRGNGFKSGVGRANEGSSKPIEILFVQGGDRNINPSKYGSSELLLPKNQTLQYEGRTYVSDSDGFSIRRADKPLSTGTEDSLDCSHIYPSRVGTVTSVVPVDAEKHFYDFIDNTIPADLNFTDYIIEGETLTVIFQSGMLAGKEFEVKYVHADRRFELSPQEIDGRTMPDSVFKPAATDTYAVFGMMLPDAYICDNTTKTGASWDMFREAAKYLFENEGQKFTFTGELDGIWAKKDWLNIGGRIKLGGYILFSDNQFQPDGVAIRIIGVKDFINNPHSPVIELSNSIVGSSITSDLRKIESNEVVVDSLYKDALQFTKRRFRDSIETINMLENALLENFTGSITPITVQTMAMLVGDESLQFQFVNNTTNPAVVAHNVTYNKTTKILTSPAGIIQHMTLGIDTLSSSHAVNEYKFWSLPKFDTPPLTDGSKKYYLYAKVSKTATTGVFYISEKAIGIEEVAGYYHLLMGILNSEYEGERSYVSLYGFTEILPGRMTTDKVVSADGLNFIDFLNNAARIGDNNTYIDFNTKKDGKLRIKGTLVQSESGDENFIGVFRGVYNSTYTYYQGDEVTYTLSGVTSTYRYIYATPTKGNVPTNATYWQIIAQGVKGDKGNTGNTGATGSTGDYYEYRYAVNGSRTSPPSLSASSTAPSGWSTTMPSVGSLQYLWCTVAKKTAAGTLIQNWGTPTRVTGYDGKDGAAGAKGDTGPTMVFRGIYSSSATYYGTSKRVDCVKYNNTYYVARVDAGNGFTNKVPTDTGFWNDFGAQFDSIATNLLLAEGANIGDWFMSGGKIVSTLGTGNKITLDASMARIFIESAASGGDYSMLTGLGSNITLDANRGIIQVEAKNKPSYSTGTSYLSPTGMFANLAGTDALPSSSGYTHRGAVVGLGFANVNKSEWSFGRDETIIAGIYGRASNSGTAPAFGGYFWDLKACGLVLNRKFITDSSSYSERVLSKSDSLIIGLCNSGITQTIYLPNDGVEGRIIFVTQMGAGVLRVDSLSGQKIYDDTSENDYYDIGEGQTGVFTFGIWSKGGTRTEVWCVGRYKF